MAYTPNFDTSASGSITTQNLVPAGTATANSAVEIDTRQKGTVSIQVEGTYTGVLSVQARVASTAVWVTLSGASTLVRDTGTYSATIPSAGKGLWQVDCTGYVAVRVTGLAAMTGTAVVSKRATDRVALVAMDTALPVGAAVIGAVTMTSTTTTPVTPTASIVNSAATTNGTVVKASAGTLYSITVSNTNAAVRYLKLHNSTSVTVGTTAVALTIPIPPGAVVNISFGTQGMRFGTGICLSTTTGALDTDTAAVAAGEIKVLTSFI